MTGRKPLSSRTNVMHGSPGITHYMRRGAAVPCNTVAMKDTEQVCDDVVYQSPSRSRQAAAQTLRPAEHVQGIESPSDPGGPTAAAGACEGDAGGRADKKRQRVGRSSSHTGTTNRRTAKCMRASREAAAHRPTEDASSAAAELTRRTEEMIRERGCTLVNPPKLFVTSQRTVVQRRRRRRVRSAHKEEQKLSERDDESIWEDCYVNSSAPPEAAAAEPAQAECSNPPSSAPRGNESLAGSQRHVCQLRRFNFTDHQQCEWLVGLGAQKFNNARYRRLLLMIFSRASLAAARTRRPEKAGASLQTTRVETSSVDAVASSMCSMVETDVAVVRALLRQKDIPVFEASVPNGLNAAGLLFYSKGGTDVAGASGDYCLVQLGSGSLFNNMPSHYGRMGGIREAGRMLARLQLDDYILSSSFGHMCQELHDMCRSAASSGESSVAGLDACWCCITLIVYVGNQAGGHVLLDRLPLSPVDLSVCRSLEAYGRAEMLRRSNQVRRGRGAREGAPQEPPVYSGDIVFWHTALTSGMQHVLLTVVSDEVCLALDAAIDTLHAQASVPGVSCDPSVQKLCEQHAETCWKMASPMMRHTDEAVPLLGISTYSFIDEQKAVLPLSDSAGKNTGADLELWCGTGVSFGRSLPETSNEIIGVGAPLFAGKPGSPPVGIMDRLSIVHVLCTASPPCQGWSLRCAIAYAARSSTCRHTNVTQRQRERMARSVWPAHKIDAVPQTHETSGFTRSILVRRRAHHGKVRKWHTDAFQSALRAYSEQSERPVAADACGLISGFSEAQHCTVPLQMSKCIVSDAPQALEMYLSTCIVDRWTSVGRRVHCTKTSMISEGVGMYRLNQQQLASYAPPPIAALMGTSVEVLTDLYKSAGTFDSVAIASQYCLHGARRVVDVLCDMRSRGAPFEHITATLLVAASQACYISDAAHCTSKRHVINRICNSGRITCPDNSAVPMCTVYDALVGVRTGLSPCCIGSAWEGVYGSTVDHGRSPIGLDAHNTLSDNRLHGTSHLSQELSNQGCINFAKHRLVPLDEQQLCCSENEGPAPPMMHAVRPNETMGEPHGLIVGVHGCLEAHARSMQHIRGMYGTDYQCGVIEVLVPAAGAWGQMLDTTGEYSSQSLLHMSHYREDGVQTAASGKVPLPTSTDQNLALLTPPLISQPSRRTARDNIFNTPLQFCEGFFQAASTLSMLAMLLPIKKPHVPVQRRIKRFHDLLDRWLTPGHPKCGRLCTEELRCVALGLAMLLCMYPTSWLVGENAWSDGCAAAIAGACSLARGAKPNDLTLQMCLHASLRIAHPDAPPDENEVQHMLQQCAAFWKPFSHSRTAETCAWQRGVGPLLLVIAQNDGCGPQDYKHAHRMRDTLHTAIKCAWLVHSPDGHSPPSPPCPCATAASHDEVNTHHLDPVFVGGVDGNKQARAALVGLQSYQLRQVLALLVASGRTPCVHRVNVAVNYGQMVVRVSSNSNILTSDGKQRTYKATSPVQQDRDTAAFGTHAERENVCTAQERAWDSNYKLLEPLFLHIQKPLSDRERSNGAADKMRHAVAAREKNLHELHLQSDADSMCRRVFKQAFTSPLGPNTTQALRDGSCHVR